MDDSARTRAALICALISVTTLCGCRLSRSDGNGFGWLSSLTPSKKYEPSFADLQPEASTKSSAAQLNAQDVSLASARVPVAGERLQQLTDSGRRSITAALNNPAESTHLQSAAVDFAEALKLAPEDAVAHHGMAIICDLKQDWANAERHYKAALKARPSDPEFLHDLGYSYLLQQRFHEAEQYLSRALQVDPTFASAAEHLARIALRRNQPEEAYRMLAGVYPGGQAQAELARLQNDPLVQNAMVAPAETTLPANASLEDALALAREEGRRAREARERRQWTPPAEMASAGQQPMNAVSAAVRTAPTAPQWPAGSAQPVGDAHTAVSHGAASPQTGGGFAHGVQPGGSNYPAPTQGHPNHATFPGCPVSQSMPPATMPTAGGAAGGSLAHSPWNSPVATGNAVPGYGAGSGYGAGVNPAVRPPDAHSVGVQESSAVPVGGVLQVSASGTPQNSPIGGYPHTPSSATANQPVSVMPTAAAAVPVMPSSGPVNDNGYGSSGTGYGATGVGLIQQVQGNRPEPISRSSAPVGSGVPSGGGQATGAAPQLLGLNAGPGALFPIGSQPQVQQQPPVNSMAAPSGSTGMMNTSPPPYPSGVAPAGQNYGASVPGTVTGNNGAPAPGASVHVSPGTNSLINGAMYQPPMSVLPAEQHMRQMQSQLNMIPSVGAPSANPGFSTNPMSQPQPGTSGNQTVVPGAAAVTNPASWASGRDQVPAAFSGQQSGGTGNPLGAYEQQSRGLDSNFNRTLQQFESGGLGGGSTGTASSTVQAQY